MYYVFVGSIINYLVHFVTGTYGIKPPLPAVGGNEGVGEVTEVGSEVKSLRSGDQVVLRADLSLGNGLVYVILTLIL